MTAMPTPTPRPAGAPSTTTGNAPAANVGEPLLKVDDLKVWFPITGGVLRRRTGWVYAVDGVSLTINKGETLGLVGESGSGKTTTGRAIVRINAPTAGQVHLAGEDLLALKGSELRRRRRKFQMVFQDPYSSLDPRQTVGSILAEPLSTHNLASGKARRERVEELLRLVGLDPAFVQRYPHEFSGGQRQRIGIARALAVEPDLIVCDEPISALDVSIQAQVINLLERLQGEFGLTYLFIAHDLAVVRHIADRVAVMYLGKIVELASAEELYRRPLHPYTTALLSAVPVPDARIEKARRRIVLKGDIPSPANPPSGCRFHTRCWLRERLGNPEICVTTEPPLQHAEGTATDASHIAACHFAKDLADIIKPGTLLPAESATATPPGGAMAMATGTGGGSPAAAPSTGSTGAAPTH
jgi:oligopeptide/dipeptide ABC transporter ATP-binding protein